MLLQENVAVGAIRDYFDKYYNVALNIYCCGTAIAIIIFPPITQLLLDVYGWRGTMLLFCGLNMHSIPCGALFDSKHDVTQNDSEHHVLKESYLDLDESSQLLSTNMQKLKTLLNAIDIQMVTTFAFVTRVLIPGIVFGYTFASWLIYIVSFSLSFGASLKEASLIATSGGIGIAAIRIALPFVSTFFSYRQLLYLSSLLMTASMVQLTMLQSFAFLNVSSVVFGISTGILGVEIYVAIKDITREDQYVNGVSWFHLFSGFAMIVGATVTGKFRMSRLTKITNKFIKIGSA